MANNALMLARALLARHQALLIFCSAMRVLPLRSIVSAPTLIVRVANGGSVTSAISALGFISSGIAGEPMQKLFDFDRIARVDPGNFVDLTLQIPAAVAGIVDGNGTRTLQPGAYTVRVGGHAASGGVLCTLKVTGQPAFIDALAF